MDPIGPHWLSRARVLYGALLMSSQMSIACAARSAVSWQHSAGPDAVPAGGGLVVMLPLLPAGGNTGNIGRDLVSVRAAVGARILDVVREREPRAVTVPDVAPLAVPLPRGYEDAAGIAFTGEERHAASWAYQQGATHVLVPTITEWRETRTDDPIGALIVPHNSVAITLRLMRLDPPAVVGQVTFRNRARLTLNQRALRLLDDRFRTVLLQLLAGGPSLQERDHHRKAAHRLARQPAPTVSGLDSAATGGCRSVSVAGDQRVPVDERAIRILAPRPHVQLVVRRQAEAVRSIDELEQLPAENRRLLFRVRLMPRAGNHDELDAGEPRHALVVFIHQRLGMLRIHHVVHEQRGIDEMHAHRPGHRAGDAAEYGAVAGALRFARVAKDAGRVPDLLGERRHGVGRMWLRYALRHSSGEKRAGHGYHEQNRTTDVHQVTSCLKSRNRRQPGASVTLT
jgi:hypothetical protein